MAKHEPVAQEALKERYEPSDVNIRGVVLTAVISIATVVALGFVLWGVVSIFNAVMERPPATAVERTSLVPPPPQLQPNPVYDMAQFRAHEDALLHRYAWVDRPAGVAQIPIEQAMALLAQRGWPAPPAGAAEGPEGTVPAAVVVRSGGVAGTGTITGDSNAALGGAGPGAGDGSGGTEGRAPATAGGGPGNNPKPPTAGTAGARP